MAGSDDLGFTFRTRGSGDVVILRHGRVVTTLRGAAAGAFRAKAAGRAPAALQGLMARATGQYRRGNERAAGRQPRNRG